MRGDGEPDPAGDWSWARRPVRVLVVLLILVAAATGCGRGSTASTPSTAAPFATYFHFRAADFVDPLLSTNPYQPLVPGRQWIRSGTTEVGSRRVPHLVISTMTDVVRTIDGVRAVAMLDQSTDSGEVSQVGWDWYALDKSSNVWLMGGYTEAYQGGEFTNVEDGWLGAESGGRPGVLVPGRVTATTPRWSIGASDSADKGSVAEPAKIGVRTCVTFGCFRDIHAVREGEFKAIDNEIKYYAAGVGVVFNDPQLASLHQDSFELVNVVHLSKAGLAEFSNIVLTLEKRARTALSDVYGGTTPSRRAS